MKSLMSAIFFIIPINAYASCSPIPYSEMEYMSIEELQSVYCSYYDKESVFLERGEAFNETGGPFSIQPALKMASEALKCQKQKTRINRFLRKAYQGAYSFNDSSCGW